MPTIDIPDKICTHCGGTMWYTFKQGKYIKYYCFLKKEENLINFYKLNPEKRKVYKKKCDRQKSVRLTNTYLKELIIQYTDLSFNDIPQELIEIKRKQLLLIRQIKNNVKNN
jgi:hypothetical protein